MAVELVTVPGVPICGTGTYALASGTTTFSEEDLADAVQAAQDPTVVPPRIKLGHTDPRFEQAVASGELDGEPAFGTVANLRLSDDGQEIIGDLTDVPSWLADTMQSSYPGRSIEGGFGFTAPSGHKYRFVIANLALLGVTWPGVTSLSDLREVLEQNGEPVGEAVYAAAEQFVTARIRRRNEDAPGSVVAGLDLGAIRQQFISDLDEGEVPMPATTEGPAEVGPMMWWWPRSVRVEDDGSLCLIVDDDAGHLIRVPFTVAKNEVTYGTPQVVIEQYVPVTASTKAPRSFAWPTRAASRPSTTPEVTTMDVDSAVLRKRLGLADDADEAAITAALTASTDKPEPAKIPDGMVLLDAETLAALKAGAEKGTAVAARFEQTERDDAIDRAIRIEGRIAVGSRETWQSRWDKDPEGTRTLLTADVTAGGLPTGTIPVNMREIGAAADADQAPTADADHEAYMARYNPQVYARMKDRQGGGLRVRTEV